MADSEMPGEAGRGGAWLRALRGELPPDAAPADVLRRVRIVHVGTGGLLAIAAVSAVVYWALGFPLMSVMLLIGGTACLANLALLRRTLRPRLCAWYGFQRLCPRPVRVRFESTLRVRGRAVC